LLQGQNKFCDCVPQLNQKRGHHQIERYHDAGTEHKKVLDDGEDILDDQQFERKATSVLTSLDKAFGGTKNALTRDEIAALVAEVEEGAGNGSEGEGGSGDSASSGEEERELQRKSEGGSAQGSLFGFSKCIAAAKPAPKAKVASVGTSGSKKHAATAATATTPKSSIGVRKGTQPQKAKGQSTESGTQVRHLDGRMERLSTNVKEDYERIDKALQELKQKNAGANDHKGGQGKDFQAAVRAIINKARELVNDIKAASTRITRSKVDHDMSTATDTLKVF